MGGAGVLLVFGLCVGLAGLVASAASSRFGIGGFDGCGGLVGHGAGAGAGFGGMHGQGDVTALGSRGSGAHGLLVWMGGLGLAVVFVVYALHLDVVAPAAWEAAWFGVTCGACLGIWGATG
jgi:hypothetical protein